MVAVERRLPVQIAMHYQRISAVLRVPPALKQHSFPKIADYRQVMIQIELCHIGEDVSDRVVDHRRRIEFAMPPLRDEKKVVERVGGFAGG